IANPAAEDESTQGAWTLRILYEPLVNFIWIGSAMLVLGGGLSLSDRRLRVGAPRRKATAPAALPAE
ncbi:MAG: cytochrome c-type biogenesis CcmF C-terminal domain-containing protein, partial [Tateyamaria sp.]